MCNDNNATTKLCTQIISISIFDICRLGHVFAVLDEYSEEQVEYEYTLNAGMFFISFECSTKEILDEINNRINDYHSPFSVQDYRTPNGTGEYIVNILDSKSSPYILLCVRQIIGHVSNLFYNHETDSFDLKKEIDISKLSLEDRSYYEFFLTMIAMYDFIESNIRIEFNPSVEKSK